jgi:hypothetical protein
MIAIRWWLRKGEKTGKTTRYANSLDGAHIRMLAFMRDKQFFDLLIS